ncbi:AT-rich interactive domain-containing protein 3-like [Dorcoceras hygrometricum]|uniref:AT-rich interactive domain-containing protein 3-like n=1 Tax=Dorcoceras hygrometricum TaxID=472368 RepID=A0A2Z7C6H3_9LAMI|nr:AT-rich interactive domain-containing protein 3-like [Dorcoceras hygrometricum]
MKDDQEAVKDAHGGAAAAVALIENEEFQGSKGTEVQSEVEEENEESNVKDDPQVAEHVNGNSEVLEDDGSEGKFPLVEDADSKDICCDSVGLEWALPGVDAEPLNLEEVSTDLIPGENRSGEEELSDDLTPRINAKEEEGTEYGLKEEKVATKNRNEESNGVFSETKVQRSIETELHEPQLNGTRETELGTPSKHFLLDPNDSTGNESGTEEEQVAFMKELETFHRERCLEFKPPKFYQEPLNCLKLWRAVIRLGGYEQVTSLKLWRQVGESFRPPKTCTTVSWTFRGFYEKALLEYEKYKMRNGELPFTDTTLSDPVSGNQVDLNHASGSGGGGGGGGGGGRARRDAAARAMQGWHSQRLLGNGEVGDPIIKDKNQNTSLKREKHLRNIGFLKRKGSSPVEQAVKVARLASKPQQDMMVVDVGAPADWVKVNVQRTKDCFEVYALVPGFLREEVSNRLMPISYSFGCHLSLFIFIQSLWQVRVQSDPAGRLVISGQPEEQDNPWGVTPFKKVVTLPTRIDPHLTSAVVTLHGQLFVRVPFEQSDV